MSPSPAVSAASAVREAVLKHGRVEGNLLLVDSFLNHRVDPRVITVVGEELADRFAPWQPDLVLTAEASGIPPALACAAAASIPLVYAKKYLGPGDRYSFSREVTSPTKGVEYRVEVARRQLGPGLRVVVVDDFLSGGRTAEALGGIIEEAGSEVAACGFVIEKSFMPGRSLLERHGWHIESLVRVASLAGGTVVFHDEDGE